MFSHQKISTVNFTIVQGVPRHYSMGLHTIELNEPVNEIHAYTLLKLISQKMKVPVSELEVVDGTVFMSDPHWQASAVVPNEQGRINLNKIEGLTELFIHISEEGYKFANNFKA